MNIVVAQSGGPTCAINASLLGVFRHATKYEEIGTVYGSVNGIEGLIFDNLVNLCDVISDDDDVELIRQTPSTVLGSCRYKLPDFEKAWKTYGDTVEFLMVNLADDRDTPEKVEAFMADNGYEFPLYYDSEYDAAYTYGIYSIPVSLFIDADGNLSKGYIGALNAAVIESCIKEILP